MNWAAYGGHLETIKWLHQHRSEGCTEKTVCSAAAGGHLDVLEWLRADKTETLGYDAVDVAAAEGHLQGLKWSPADGASAMRDAVLRGHVPVMLFLYANYGHEVCQEGLCMLRENSEDTELRFLGMARWLLEKFEDEMVNFSVNRADWDTNQWVKNHMQQVEVQDEFVFWEGRSSCCNCSSCGWPKERQCLFVRPRHIVGEGEYFSCPLRDVDHQASLHAG